MRQSADPQERIIAQLQERVNALEMRSEPDADRLQATVGRLIQEGLVDGSSPIHVLEELNKWLNSTGSGYVLNLSIAPPPGVTEYCLIRRGTDGVPIRTYLFPK
jgi:hypothetical protein